MVIKPSIRLSLKQSTAPKNLMRQLIKLLPLNETELEDLITREVNENPFLSFPVSKNQNIDLYSEDLLPQSQSIFKIILPQINNTFSGENKKIAMHFLSDLDDDGFLRQTTNPYHRQGLAVLKILQTLEPSGVFSRNLQEFYLNYLTAEDKLTAPWETFINNIDNIAVGDTQSIIKKMGSSEVFNAFLDSLKDLPTTPNIQDTMYNIVIPDVIVSDKGDSFSCALNSNLHSILNVDQDYVEDIRTHKLKSQDKAFIREKFASAKWLKTALVMRAEIMLNIAVILTEKQLDFLKGRNLKPLTMLEVSKQSSVHISTVSRIVNNKYLSTPIGTISFKNMFSGVACVSTTKQDNISQDTVIKAIQKLVAGEINTKIVLSDEKITKFLNQQGYLIARRTVAKYRKLCNINPSHLRKDILKRTKDLNK